MSVDFFADNRITSQDINNANWKSDYHNYTRIQLLTNCIWDDNSTLVDAARDNDGLYRKWLSRFSGSINTTINQMKDMGVTYPQDIDWSVLPNDSYMLTVNFSLDSHLTTRDDTDYYIIENPMCKDTAFKIPMMRASSWKGYLRWSCVHRLIQDIHNLNDLNQRDRLIKSRIQLSLLFGNEQGVEVDSARGETYLDDIFSKKFGHDSIIQYRKQMKAISSRGMMKGKLHFYPTFFNKINLDIINPHKLETKSGENPILMEVAPRERRQTHGVVLLYAPLCGGSSGTSFTAKSDLLTVVQALEELMLIYGFSAKRTSGYGIIYPHCKGNIKGPNLAQIMPGVNLRNGNEFAFRSGFSGLKNALNIEG
ncbi:hypothetical protein GF312_01045 [Candidatus Poribacteria bacterium]|nr:hypothetical protein [Candidatus Poribacteria bacterium]